MSDLLVALRDFERDYMVLQVRFESAEVAMAHFVLKTTQTVSHIQVYNKLYSPLR